MTRLFNDPSDFVADMTRGFALAASRWIRAVPGGVVRSTKSTEPTVAVVIGGGSGHYPAFSGLVGPGLAHGAAMGNVFASPSTKQIVSVARHCEQGRGVLFTYGNYAGDVLNFDQAQRQLRDDGIDTRTVIVTDDIFSAPSEEIGNRRGIAGDLAVFKVAGAAAEAGYELADVERVARAANDATRSIGVAFSGCTLPGASAPLFSVPEGRMAVGLGIHGEPGIEETALPAAAELAELLVFRLLDEAPRAAGRVVPILNGLGTVKYEELYLLYGLIDPLLRSSGIDVVDPEVGEFCTSFDMAGLSLTLLWLDEELEQLWTAPVSSAAFTRGSFAATHPRVDAAPSAADGKLSSAEIRDSNRLAASTASRRLGRHVAEVLTRIAAVLDDSAEELGRLDSVAGDGDHGIGMQRGSRAAAEEAASATAHDQGPAAVLRVAAEAWADVGGGTSGAIWGRILGTLATGFEVDGAPSPADIARALSSTFDDVRAFGEVEIGDKTLVDALGPLSVALSAAVKEAAAQGPSDTNALTVIAVASARAAQAAADGAEGTAELSARRGRARAHGDKSIGTPDPGAVSLARVASAVASELSARTAKTAQTLDDEADAAGPTSRTVDDAPLAEEPLPERKAARS